ncbi:MAG TPA: tyrosine-type recombinase/integrase [Solirubrobacterales bacterium]
MKRCNCKPSYIGKVWDRQIGRNRLTVRTDDIHEARHLRTDLYRAVHARTGRHGSRAPIKSSAAIDGDVRPKRIRLRDLHAEFIDACESGIALNRHGHEFTEKARKDLDSSLRNLPDWMRSMYVDELDDSHFQRAVDEFRSGKKPLSSSRINHRINAVRSMSNWGVPRKKMPAALAVEVRLPADDSKPRDRIATPGEFAHLLDLLKPHDALPWALAAYGTARAQEIEALEWPEVDFEEDNLLLGAHEDAEKSEAARRVVPMVRQLRDRMYAEWLRQGKPKTGRVCKSRRQSASGKLSLNNLQQRRSKIWLEHDLRPIGLQDSRHTAATWMDHAGVSPKVISALMGHKAPKRQPGAAPITLRRYTHVLPGELERARDKLQRFLDERETEEADRSFAVAT